MSDSLQLSLQASHVSDPSKDSVQSLIARINEQRGSFRNVTEESLEEEIRRGEVKEADDIEDEDDAAETNDARPRREILVAAREDMLRQVG